MDTILKFARGLKKHLRSVDRYQIVEEIDDMTEGCLGGCDVNWDELDAEIDAFADEFRKPGRPVTEWQPIETAPRDSRSVLCGFATDYGRVGWYWFGENVRGHAAGRWYAFGEQEWVEPQPTHWIKLPPLPSDAPQTPELADPPR